MKTTDALMESIYLKRELRIRKARNSFWTFCRVIDDPDYYTKDKWHLRLYAEVLELFNNRLLNRKTFRKACQAYAPKWFTTTAAYNEMFERLDERGHYEKLMINLPPRSGKTRTLTHFTKYALGKNKRESIMTATYNDTLAQDFSRATRDGIQAERGAPVDIVFTDIFPESTMRWGQAAAGKWTLDGGYQSYTGIGLNGSATGRGGTIQIVDDPIKDSKTAYNAVALDAINLWYAATFYSRQEQGCLAIVNHTRWAENDLCGYLLGLENGNDWFVFKLPAFFDDVQECLNPAELGPKRIADIRIVLPKDIFEANYNQHTIDIKGRLYTSFMTYDELPRNADKSIAFEQIVAYCDTADTGDDDLVQIIAGIYEGRAYVLDVYMTDEDMTVTEIEQADLLVKFGVTSAMFEGNNGGSNHARAVEEQIWKRHKTRSVSIDYFHQGENKQARILAHQSDIMRLLWMPEQWQKLFPKYYKSMTTYQRKGKNKHDDAPDCSTGMVEHFLEVSTLRIGVA